MRKLERKKQETMTKTQHDTKTGLAAYKWLTIYVDYKMPV